MDILVPHDGRSPFAELSIESGIRCNLSVRNLSEMDNFSSTDWDQFHSAYAHLSANPRQFELSCFKRYFYCLSFARLNKIDKFIMADTDIVYFPDFQKLFHLHQNSELPGLSLNIGDATTHPHFSPHSSLWDLSALAEFTQFLIETYKSPRSRDELHKLFGNNGVYPNQSSDMTLLYLWIKQSNRPWTDTSKPWDRVFCDHNISLNTQGGVKFFSILGTKVIAFRTGAAMCRFENGEKVSATSLHFQGQSKRLMKYAISRSTIKLQMGLILLTAARRAKSIAQMLGITAPSKVRSE